MADADAANLTPLPLDYQRGGPHAPHPSLHDVWAEPHQYRRQPPRPEPTVTTPPTAGDRHLTSVWDEPTTSAALAGYKPAADMAYADWLAWGVRQTSRRRTWLVTFACALAGGPVAVLGTLFWTGTGLNAGLGAFAVIAAVFVAPVIEEATKAAAALWVAEVRPFRFGSSAQVVLCLLAAGLGFSTLENLVYLFVYVPDAPPSLWLWRWTVCVALHTVCSGIAGIGVARVWAAAMRRRKPPAVALAGPLLIAAALVHGLYNAAVIALEAAGWIF